MDGVFLKPFPPAQTRQSTEKLQQHGVEERLLCHVGCWWAHWLDGVSSFIVPCPGHRGPQHVARLQIPYAVAACAPGHTVVRRDPESPCRTTSSSSLPKSATSSTTGQHALRRHLPGSRRRRWLRGAAVVAVRGERWDCICMLATCVV